MKAQTKLAYKKMFCLSHQLKENYVYLRLLLLLTKLTLLAQARLTYTILTGITQVAAVGGTIQF